MEKVSRFANRNPCRLDLIGTKVTVAAIAALQEALPKSNVVTGKAAK